MDYDRPVDQKTDVENANLGSEIISAAAAVGRLGGIPLIPGPDNTVILPAGATLDDVTVQGRDLVINVDGTVYVIPNGAVFVPVLVVDGVAVPPLNLAAYLNENVPEPAAGTPQSSGGNFADPTGPIQSAYGLGNLLPYTELSFPEQQTEEVLPYLNNKPEITFVPRIGDVTAGTQVEEAGLASNTPVRNAESPGSQEPSDLETTSNTITFESRDGVSSISIGGVVINPNALPQVIVTDQFGTLTITGYTFDNATKTGSITYQYTLGDNTLDPDGSQVSFPIVLIDGDGDAAEDVLVIKIIDDVPTAHEDSNSVDEGGTTSGNVLPNDLFGADGPAQTSPAGGIIGVRAADGDTTTPVEAGLGTEIRGQYGTLILHADGSYTYKADANVIALDQQDVFVYTIEDGDEGGGDLSTTTLTIDINAITLISPQADPVVIVNEAALDLAQDGADLAPGTVTGRNPGLTTETVAGNITVIGASTYVIENPAGNYGVISIDNAGNFVYTLTKPVDNQVHADDGTEIEPAQEVFHYVASDANGNAVSGTITVNIIDDIPVATADVASVNEGGTAIGNVLPNDIFGADGPTATSPSGGVLGVRKANGDTTTPVTTGTGAEIQGDYGKLVLNADGSYTYVAKPDFVAQNVQEVFVYTIQDSDGDRSTTTLTINVLDISLVADNERVTVFEAALDLIQDGDDLAPGTVTGSAPSNTLETVSGTLDVPSATGFTIIGSATGTYGVISIDSSGHYVYTLTKPVDNLQHANDGNDVEAAGDVFTYRATDANGNFVEGTITVDIVDDVPFARADFNSVAENSSVSGNVLPNDAFGADGPDLTLPAGGVVGVRAANGDTITPITSGTGQVIVGNYGTLVLNADGSYTYQAGDVATNVSDVFVYTIRDSDGDLSTTTLTISIGDTFNDLFPTAGTATVLLDDDVLSGGNPDGPGDDDPDAPVVFPIAGTLPGSGGNGPLSWTFAASVAPAGFTYDTSTPNQLVIMQGATPIATIVLNPATGGIQVTQNNPAMHASGGEENNQSFSINYTVTDSDGDPANGTLTVDLDDDIPVVEISAAGTALISDESLGTGGSTEDEGGAVNNDEAGTATPGAIGYATGSLVSVTTFSAGADGEASRSYVLSVTNATSGLTDTATGQPVTLSMNGAVLEGKNADGQLVFTLSVDGSGNGTLTQFRAVVHNDPADHDENSGSEAVLNADTIGLTASLTDTDGDTASQKIDISGLIKFEDDGPAVTGEADEATVSVDESNLAQAAGTIVITGFTQGIDTHVGNGLNPTVVSASSGALISATPDYGTDGAATSGSLVYSFELSSGATSLTTTEGTPITLVKVSDTVVVGQIGASTVAAFALELQSDGSVKVEQYVSLANPTPGDGTTPAGSYDEPVDLSSSSLAIQVTVKDGDGDTAMLEDPIAIGSQISFHDDGPTAVDDIDNISGGSGPATGNVITGVDVLGGDANNADGVADDQGADGAQITKIVSDATSNEDDTPEGGTGELVVVGQYGTLTIHANGDYSYLRTDLSPGDKSESFTYTLTDGDGDTDTAVLTISIGDAPVNISGLTPELDGGDAVVDEDDLVPNGSDPSKESTTVTGSFIISAPDGVDDVTVGGIDVFIDGVFQLNASGTTPELGNTIKFTGYNPATGEITYEYTLDANESHPSGNDENFLFDHMTVTLTDTDGDFDSDTLVVKVIDDIPVVEISAAGTALISDESLGTGGSTEDEGGAVNNDEAGTATPGAIGYATGSLVSVTTFSAGADGEASRSYVLSVTNATSGLTDTATGQPVTLSMNGAVLEGKNADGQLVFTLSVDGSGNGTLTQFRAVVHNDPADHDENSGSEAVLNADTIGLTASLTDTDGDTASQKIDISGLIKFEDDGPAVTGEADEATVSVDESNLAQAAGTIVITGFTQGIDTHVGNGLNPTVVSASSGALISATPDYGTDGAATSGSLVYSFELSSGATSLTTTEGTPITLVKVSDTVVVGQIGASTVAAFALELQSDGSVKVEQYVSLANPTPGDGTTPAGSYDEPVDLSSSSLAIQVTVKDGDGDTAMLEDPIAIGSQISFHDDGPFAAISTSGVNVVHDETPGQDLDANDTSGSLSVFDDVQQKGEDPDVAGTSAIGFAVSANGINSSGSDTGVDGGTIAVTLSTVDKTDSGLQTTEGLGIYLFMEGDFIVGRAGLDGDAAASGDAAFAITLEAGTNKLLLAQYLSIKHPTNPNPDEGVTITQGAITATVKVTDGDGDTHTASSQIGNLIGFQDDGPVAVDDTDAVASGTNGPATGNVLTGTDIVGGDTNLTDGNADTAGADGGLRVTFIDNDNNVDPGKSIADGGSTTIDGEYGTLTLYSNGDYSYDRNPGEGAGESEQFTYTVIDGDGDTDTATLTIAIANATPTAGTVSATLDDDALTGGIADGPGDDNPNTSNLSGDLPGSGGDSPLTFELLNTGVIEVGGATGFTYEKSGDDLLIKQNGNTVITVSLTDTSTGAYTIVQNLPIKHAAGGDENNQTFTISYTVSDTDNDSDSGSITINVDDDSPTVTAALNSSAIAGLDETATSSTAPALGVLNIGDDPHVSGSGAISTATSGSSVLTIGGGYGADGAGSLVYALAVSNANSGVTVTDGSAINLVNEGGVIVGRVQAGAFSGQAAFAISIDAGTGVVSVEQYLSLNHPNAANPDDTISLLNGSLSASVTRTDSDGDSAVSSPVDISSLITFDDDGPTMGTITSATVTNGTNEMGTGTFSYAPGADGHQSFSITGTPPAGATYGVVQNANGALLTATAGPDTIFTLQVNTDGTYKFTLVTPDAGSTTTTPLQGLSPGGPTPFIQTASGNVEFYLITGDGGVNSGGQGFGVDNQYVREGEAFGFEFHNPGQPGDQAPTTNAQYFNSASLIIGDVNKSVEYDVFIYNDGAGTSEQVLDNYVVSATGTMNIVPNTLTEFNRVEIIAVGGEAKTGQGTRFDTLTATKTILPQDIDLQFNITATDQDGDTTAIRTLTIMVDAAPPIVLDLDGDGVEFLSQDAGVLFDYGSGLVATAWAGADDGLLARHVSSGLDIVFTDDASGANSDLEGLRMAFDSDGDGELTSGDTAWSEFGVWQDANSDGIVDAGEFRSLDDMGIASIDLYSDGVAYSAAAGDVKVHGEAVFTRTDGSTGVLADASFAINAQKAEARSVEFTTAAVAAGMLATTLLVDAPDAAIKGLVVIDTTGQDVPPAALIANDTADDGSNSYDGMMLDPVGSASQSAEAQHSSISDDDDASVISDADMGALLDHYGSDVSSDASSSDIGFVGASVEFSAGTDLGGGDIIQGLLMMAQGEPTAQKTSAPESLNVVEDAIVEAQGESFIDHLVLGLGGGDGETPTDGVTHSAGTSIDGLQLFLAADVSSHPVAGQDAFDFNSMTEEANAAAAAA